MAPTIYQWLALLSGMLERQRLHARIYDQYYSGERALQILYDDYADVFGKDAYGRLKLDPPYTNVSAIGVDAKSERLVIEGFRVGDDDNRDGAQAADTLWQGSDMDVMSPIGHTEALIKGTALELVWPNDRGQAVISIEDPEQMVVHRSSLPPYDVDAALKVYCDEWTGREVAILWLQNEGRGVFDFGAMRTMDGNVLTPWRLNDTLVEPLPPQLGGRVPVSEIANRARLLRPPTSDIVAVAPLADTLAKLLGDMMIAASFGAIPVRTGTGVKLPRRTLPDGTEVPYSPYNVRADRMLVSENPEARFGMLEVTSLAGYATAVDMVLRNIRLVTRVPQHYYGDGVNAGMSGETLKASEASLDRNVDGIKPRFGVGHRKTMSFGFAIEGSPFASARIVPRWRDTQTQVESQQTDAAQKYDAMGVPLEITLERVGWDRATIERVMRVKATQDLAGEAQKLIDNIRRGIRPAPAPGDTVPALPAA